MIINFMNTIYVDANIPQYIAGSGEHMVELYTACSRGKRLGMKVVVIKPEHPVNDKIYDLIPNDVRLLIINSKTIYAHLIKILIWIISKEFLRLSLKQIYLWLKTKAQNIDRNKKKHKSLLFLNSYVKKWVESKFYNTKLYLDKKEVSNGITFKIRDDDIEFSKKYLNGIGFNVKNKFVCIHLRDHVDDLDKYKKRCSMDEYYTAIKYLEKEGYFVVKIGKNSGVKYDKATNFIDLAHDSIPNIVLLYLVSKCEFVVSYHTAFIPFLAGMFDKPVLALNVTDPITSYPIKYNFMFVLKKLVNRHNNEEVNFCNFTDGENTRLIKGNKFDDVYKFIDNTSEEVLLSIIDMIKFIDSGFKANSDQILIRNFLTENNVNLLKRKKDVALHNYYMRWSGGNFIGSGLFCYWYVKKKKYEILDCMASKKNHIIDAVENKSH
jgi:putative glycosyltransferase (TIGR04372 family)